MAIAKTTKLTVADIAKIDSSFKLGREYGIGGRLSGITFAVYDNVV